MIFPLALIPIALFLNGSPVVSYNSAFLKGDRILAPIAPLFTQIADRIAYESGTLRIFRGDRFTQVRVRTVAPTDYPKTFIAIGSALRDLGLGVRFNGAERALYITTPSALPKPSMTPFNPNVPRPAPTMIFTPEHVATPRPVFTGAPRPRRTPIAIGSSPP